MKDIEEKLGKWGRTNLGEIFRFAWIEDSSGVIYTRKIMLFDNNNLPSVCYLKPGEHIVKHSYDLLDLIENRDIAMVRTCDDEILYVGLDETTTDVADYAGLIENIKNRDYQLLKILTHEQFDANCYEIEEKE